jgi:hypothetical protein
VEDVGSAGRGDADPDARFLLLHRFRCVAFAALGADVTEQELLDAVQVAVRADQRRRLAARRHLHVVHAGP